MPDPWATYKRPSANEGQTTTGAPPETSSCVPANKGTKGFRETRSWSARSNVEMRSTVDEALDFYVKATGKDGTQKRQELMNMRPGDQRRSLEHLKTRAEEEERFQRTKEAKRKTFEEEGPKSHEQLKKREREEGARVVK